MEYFSLHPHCAAYDKQLRVSLLPSICLTTYLSTYTGILISNTEPVSRVATPVQGAQITAYPQENPYNFVCVPGGWGSFAGTPLTTILCMYNNLI
jgi:hypothetical protein